MNRDEIRAEIEKLIELVKFDYQHSLGFIDGVVRVSIGIRAIAMAGCLALLAAALQTEEVVLAAFSLLAAAAFGIQDAYHGWLYAEARDRAAGMEALLDTHYRQCQHGASAAGELQLLKRLRRHSIGLKLSLAGPVPPRSRLRQAKWRREFTLRWLRLAGAISAITTVARRARPRIVYWILYPLLAIVSLAVVAVLTFGSTGSDPSPPRPVRICVGCDAHPSIRLLPPTKGEVR